MSIFSGPEIQEDGLVLYLDAANQKSYPGTGTNWFNLTGSINGTITGATYSTTDLGLFSFDGVNDTVNLGPSNAITGNNLQTLTVSIWLKYTSTAIMYSLSILRLSTASTLFSVATNVTTGGAASIGRLGFLTRDFANTAHVYLTDSGPYNDGNWYNLTGVINGLNRYLYINGVLKNSDSLGMQSVTGNTANAHIGSFGATSNFYSGSISLAMIYNRALSAQEVTQNYLATKSRYGL